MDVFERLWRIYVERMVMFGMGAARLSKLEELDRPQRKAGSMHMCVFSFELGWTTWSAQAVREQLGLPRRTLGSTTE